MAQSPDPKQARLCAVIVTHQSDLNALKRAVDGLKACEHPIEIILVDNHSSTDYRADLSRSFTDVTIIDSGINKGFGAGHNLGFALKKSDAPYHLVVNPDVRVPAGSIEAMVAFMDAHPEIGLCTPKITDASGTLQYLSKRKPNVLALFGRRFLPSALADILLKGVMNRYTMRDKDYDSILEPEFLSGCFMMFRTSVFKQIGGFDERFFLYFEDADITLRVRKVSKAVHFPGATIIHDWKGGARQSGYLTRRMMVSAWKFFTKWGLTWW